MITRFKDRRDAGAKLAEKLYHLKGEDTLVLAIPRGGVIVGDVIAKTLDSKLDVVCPRKLGALGNPELAIGAIMHDGTYILNENIIRMLRIPDNYIREEMEKKKQEALKRLMLYRGNDRYELDNKTIILVDDGVATGATALVAAKWLTMHNIKRLIIAMPVGPPDTLERLRQFGDVIAILMPYDFGAVGEFYDDFGEVDDSTVLRVLANY
ncbi:MAG: phosphoribosyltransferase [Candidatus Nitrosocaldaceae archaeon]|nr:MAG: phosphoribosyltransferase [Candidatus Nitrosocaldaceae archaeon]